MVAKQADLPRECLCIVCDFRRIGTFSQSNYFLIRVLEVVWCVSGRTFRVHCCLRVPENAFRIARIDSEMLRFRTPRPTIAFQ